MFPGPHSTIYRNEEGEVLGWSNETDYEPDQDLLDEQWERTHCLDCGERNDECKCDLLCESCQQFTINLETDECDNAGCSSNIPDCPRGCGELAHHGPCNPHEQGD